ncbi:unnamed protein product [Sphagnum jensenii]|uniref:Exocyst subunit Exo70 family protein n=1 Tax=Sphagnum jensenii TaxID=128206 RepID=A0ABP0X349_9BRYO
MAASDGEERVLLTAQRIVKSLGTNDTMTDDMLQILSKFDHRFSSMNDKSKKNESTSSQESDELESIPPSSRTTLASNPTPLPPRKPSRKTGKSSLDRAEDVIIHWDIAYSEEARESMIFECPPEDALAYLGAVDKVQNVLETLTVHDTDPGMLERVQNLLQLAMVRLEEEFRNMLDKHSESVDPDWLLDCLSAGSFANIQDNAVRAAPESSGEDDDDEDDDDDDIPVAEPVGDLPSIVDLVLPEVALDLQNIAQRMVTAGFRHECCNVYVDVRKRVLEDSLYRLGVERLSIDEVQKLPWETQEHTIKKWNQAMKVGVKVLFASEKQLCDQVFPVNFDFLFCEISKGIMMQMLSFGEAIAISRRSPEKLFRILDMYETLRDLIPDIDSIFSGSSGTSVRSEASGILMRLGEAARGTFAEFENAIQRDGSKTPVPGGTVHPLTRYVMNYIKLLCDYTVTLKQLFGENKKEVRMLLGDSNGTPVAYGGDDARDGKEELSPLAVQINWLTHVLRNNLEGKSKLYKDVALTHLFLMNNVHYTVQKVKSSEVRALIGDDWVRKHTSLVRQYATSYQRAAWSKVLGFLRDEGIHSSVSLSTGVSRVVLKDRFKNFNLAFDEVHKAQSTWVVVDPELRDELRIYIADKILPAYRAFVGRYGQFLETGRHPDKYIKYQPEDLEAAIGDFFEGSSSNSMAVRRKSLPHQ